MTRIHLADKAIVSVSGPDAEHFLQNLVTTDIESVSPNEAWPGALLTPQGKIMLEFLVLRSGDGFLLETHEDDVATLVQRLTLYKLRAKVEIASTESKGVTVFLDEEAPSNAVLDHRFDIAGLKLYRSPGFHEGAQPNNEAYGSARIRCGVAEMHSDYATQDVFPHDILFDKNGGVSFRKGCYVGQEVVSRMQHRGTARRRLIGVSANSKLPNSGAAITAGGKSAGTLGSISEHQGLAIVRTDRIASAIKNGSPVLAGEVPVEVSPFDWSGVSLDSEPQED